jgi:hypothetical protein
VPRGRQTPGSIPTTEGSTMRMLLATAALLAALATPATAQDVVRGRLVSMSDASFLCAVEGGFETRQCRDNDNRVRIYVLERADTHADVEIQLASRGECLGVEGPPAPGARVEIQICERQVWRFDFERHRLTHGGLCLETQPAASGDAARVILAACDDASPAARRQEWAFATDE